MFKPYEAEPPLLRLDGNDEDGWQIEDDPLLRVWDTAHDAMTECPADWWQEEDRWYCTAFTDEATNRMWAWEPAPIVVSEVPHG